MRAFPTLVDLAAADPEVESPLFFRRCITRKARASYCLFSASMHCGLDWAITVARAFFMPELKKWLRFLALSFRLL